MARGFHLLDKDVKNLVVVVVVVLRVLEIDSGDLGCSCIILFDNINFSSVKSLNFLKIGEW